MLSDASEFFDWEKIVLQVTLITFFVYYAFLYEIITVVLINNAGKKGMIRF